MPETTTNATETSGQNDLRCLLHTVDSWSPPAPVPVLLRAGRRRTRVTRLRRATPLLAAAAAAVLVGVALRTAASPVAPATPGASTARSIPSAAATPIPSLGSADVTLADVRSRCAPQLARFAALPQYAAAVPVDPTWTPVLAGPYRVGDVLRLAVTAPVTTPGPNPRWCRVPAVGHEDDAVAMTTFQLRGRPDAEVAQLCRQLAAPADLGLGDATSAVLARTPQTPDPGPTLVLLRTRTGTVACSTVPVEWDAGGSSAGLVAGASAPQTTLGVTLTGPAGKSASTPAAAWYFGVGTVPGATRVVVSVRGIDHDAAVVDGTYVVSVEDRGAARMTDYTTTAYRADGTVLGRWTTPLG